MLPNKISLIGMPSAGKTVIAEELANKLLYKHIDLDSIVEEREGRSLIDILETDGGKFFLDIENDVLHALKTDEKVIISTAGSIIYHDEAMNWLRSNSRICFIDSDFSVIEQRLSVKPKAVIGLKEKGLRKLWDERLPIYKKWADISVSTHGKDLAQIANEIISRLSVNS